MKKIIFFIGIIINAHGMEQQYTFGETELTDNIFENESKTRAFMLVNQKPAASLCYYKSSSYMAKYDPQLLGDYKDQLDKTALITEFRGPHIPNVNDYKKQLIQHICTTLSNLGKEYVLFKIELLTQENYKANFAILKSFGFTRIEYPTHEDLTPGFYFFLTQKSTQKAIEKEYSKPTPIDEQEYMFGNILDFTPGLPDIVNQDDYHF